MTIIKDIQTSMPLDHTDCHSSLNSVKQRHPVLVNISSSGLGYIHSTFSNCWMDVEKNNVKDGDLHYDQSMEKF
jgi:hypothetical protein